MKYFIHNGRLLSCRIKLEEPVTPLNSARIISAPLSVSSQHSRSHSQLSSPFMSKLPLTSPKISVSEIQSPPSSSSGRPIHLDDTLSKPIVTGQPSTPKATVADREHPPGRAPCPTRYVQPPIARAYFQGMENAVAEDAAEREVRRPDFFKRSFRPSSADQPGGVGHFDKHAGYVLDPSLLTDAHADSAVFSGTSGLGVTESPLKGRRITLFQETSEESFEESLLAGGYGKYRTIPPEPQFHTQVHQPEPTIPSQTAPGHNSSYQPQLYWLHASSSGTTPQATTPTPGPSAIPGDPLEKLPSTATEARKRRRLNAFRGPVRPLRRTLQPVKVEGMGRILLNLTNDESLMPNALDDLPWKKRTTRRKKATKGTQSDAPSPKHPSPVPSIHDEFDGPDWLDSEFPWNMRIQERAETARSEEEHRLQWISKFLERESDSDDEEHDILPSAAWSEIYEPEEPPMPVRMGRGKMVPLKANPSGSSHFRSSTQQRPKRGMFFPSDPSDARAALLSKRRARTIMYRMQKQRKGWEDDDSDGNMEIVCLCRGWDDGREMVNCDGCRTWYHLECIGVHDADQLGAHEDAWYCSRCSKDHKPGDDNNVRIRSRSPNIGRQVERSVEPMLVPTDDSPAQYITRDPLFAPAYFQASPAAWVSQAPSTPIREVNARSYEASSRASFGSTPHTTAGPSTPHSSAHPVRVYSTPNLLDTGMIEDFDPLSTPSRGVKFSGGLFTTPKPNWSARATANGLFQTPSRLMERPGPPLPFHDDHRDTLARQYDDRTKVIRSGILPGRSLWEPESPSPAGKRVGRSDFDVRDK
jgi:hypothetical protein